MDSIAELRPGRFSDRFVAYLIDTFPFLIGAVATVWTWGGPLNRALDDRTLLAIGAAWSALAALWQFVGNLGGGTLGKKALGLSVVAADGAPPGAGRALARALGWAISTPLFNLGFLIALFHPRTRALDDLISGTFVVESGPRRSNGALLFLLAVLAAAGLLAGQAWVNLMTPTRADIAAVVRAQEGLEVVAKIEEAYREKHGTYADSLQDLAEASGNVELFRSAMLDVFSPTPFRIQAGNRGWRVTAAAKDRRRTLVHRDGP